MVFCLRMLLSTFILLYSYGLFASDTTIQFQKVGSYDEIIDLAKNSGKPVLLYFHFDGCGACVKMEKTVFNEPEVARYFNTNFIPIEVNTKKGNGPAINEHFKVQLHPSFIYINSKGDIAHTFVGISSPEEFLEISKTAYSDNSLSALTKKYENMELNEQGLLNYAYALRNAAALDSSIIMEYLNTQSTEHLSAKTNLYFIYEFAFHEFDVITPISSRPFQHLLNNQVLYEEHFDADQIKSRIVWIAKETAQHALKKKDSALFWQAHEILKKEATAKEYWYKNMEGHNKGIIVDPYLAKSLQLAYYRELGDTANYNQLFNEYLDMVWDDPSVLNSLAWNYYQSRENKEDLQKAKSWSARAVELDSSYMNLDTYAALLYKLREYDEALQWVDKAIAMAKELGIEYQETAELKVKIIAARP